MKTTVEITDSLLARAREIAAREGTSVRALIEEGLRQVVQQRQRGRNFQLPDCSVAGEGLTDQFADAPFSKILRAAYGDE